MYGKALFSTWDRESPVSVGLHTLNVTVNVTLSVSCTHEKLTRAGRSLLHAGGREGVR